MHLQPCILRKHIAPIGSQESPEEIGPVSLEWLGLSPGGFLELLDKSELDNLVLRECAILILQGGNFGPQSCQLC